MGYGDRAGHGWEWQNVCHQEPVLVPVRRVGRVRDRLMPFMGHSLPPRPLRLVRRENHDLALLRLPDRQEGVSLNAQHGITHSISRHHTSCRYDSPPSMCVRSSYHLLSRGPLSPECAESCTLGDLSSNSTLASGCTLYAPSPQVPHPAPCLFVFRLSFVCVCHPARLVGGTGAPDEAEIAPARFFFLSPKVALSFDSRTSTCFGWR